MSFPKRYALANPPTRIEPLSRLSALLNGPEIWFKRDDQTGTELSGNKVRKLEYAIQEALNQGCDTLVTCGGFQSNHARATAAAAAKLGMGCILILNAESEPPKQGNYLMDDLLNADVRFIAPEDAPNRQAIMDGVLEELSASGRKGYILPLGASNGIGSFGYANAMTEICKQEKELGFRFDTIACAVGSGGTYGGLVLGKKLEGHPGTIYGIPIAESASYFRPVVHEILKESAGIMGIPLEITPDELQFLDGYAGRGYALSQPEELDSLRLVARTEGIILDPVYTGKAMHGLIREIRKGTFTKDQKILFIHTGGLYGIFHFLADENPLFGKVK